MIFVIHICISQIQRNIVQRCARYTVDQKQVGWWNWLLVHGKIVASGCLTLSKVHIVPLVLHFFISTVDMVRLLPWAVLHFFSTVHIVSVTLTPSPLCCSFLHGMILAWGPVSYTFKFGIVSQTHGGLWAVSVACICSAHSGALGTVTCTLLHGVIVAGSFFPLTV